MFATFVDWKILAGLEGAPEPNLLLFDERLRVRAPLGWGTGGMGADVEAIRERYGQAMVRTPTYEETPDFTLSRSQPSPLSTLTASLCDSR